MKKVETDFSKGSVLSLILRLAIPMTFAQVVNLLYNIVDRMYIGKIAGDGNLALTGLGLCFPIITMIMAFTNLYGTGGAPLSSIERGKQNNEEASRIMNTCFYLLVLTGIVITILGFLFERPLLYLFGASDVTYPFASSYIRIYLLGTVFVMISLGMNYFINNQGFAKIGMLTTFLGCITNIILDPILIFTFHLGIKGAAIATVFSQCLSAIWVLRFLCSDKPVLKLNKKHMKLQWKRISRILSLGFAGFIVQVTNGAVQVVCNASLQYYGQDLYVGVMTILSSIRDIMQTPVHAVGSGCTPVMSFNYGAKNYDRVKQSIKIMALSMIILTSISWLVVILFPRFFIVLFNDDPALVKAAIPSLHIYFFGFVFMALQFSGQSTFSSLGKAKQAVFFSIFRKIIIVVPLTIILPIILHNGVVGVFMAEPISNLVGGCASFFTMVLTVIPELNNAKKKENGIIK